MFLLIDSEIAVWKVVLSGERLSGAGGQRRAPRRPSGASLGSRVTGGPPARAGAGSASGAGGRACPAGGPCFYSLMIRLRTSNPEPGSLVGGSVNREREDAADGLIVSKAVASGRGCACRRPEARDQRRGPPSHWGLPRPAPWTRPPSRTETCVSTTQSRGLRAWVVRSLRPGGPAPYGGSGGSWIQEEKTASYLSEPCGAPGQRTQPWEAAAGGERPWDGFRSWEVLSPESWPFGTELRTPCGCSAKPGRAGSP